MMENDAEKVARSHGLKPEDAKPSEEELRREARLNGDIR